MFLWFVADNMLNQMLRPPSALHALQLYSTFLSDYEQHLERIYSKNETTEPGFSFSVTLFFLYSYFLHLVTSYFADTDCSITYRTLIVTWGMRDVLRSGHRLRGKQHKRKLQREVFVI